MSDFANVLPWVQAAVRNGTDIPPEHAAVLLQELARRPAETTTEWAAFIRGGAAFADDRHEVCRTREHAEQVAAIYGGRAVCRQVGRWTGIENA